MEEPGSKQKIALKHGRVRSIATDLIHHLVNDIIVMGAKPVAVQDVIVCGKIEKPVVTELVDAMAKACREQECSLTGGETSEQPGVVEAGTYILAASIVGVVEKSKIIDGSAIRAGDAVLAVASNGLHTNGYSLVRRLIAEKPALLKRKVGSQNFLDAILTPHRCYWRAFKPLFARRELHGLAHITGGGIQDNLNRILPARFDAAVDLGAIRILPVFKVIREVSGAADADMMRTFNMGVGMTLVVKPSAVESFRRSLSRSGLDSYVIGRIVPGRKRVVYSGRLLW
jgi:phosphoribosylformylglycinamidine cyclo-ligase